MNKYPYILVFLLLMLSSCKHTNNESKNAKTKKTTKENLRQNNQSTDSSVKAKKITFLAEDIDLLGDITSFDFIDNNNIVVSSINPSGLYIYNMEGKQTQKIGKQGKGPFEYINPSIVKVHKNKIYVWCSKQLRMIIFNSKGEPLSEYNNFNQAIRNFLRYKNYLFLYETGGQRNIIATYDLNKKEYIDRFGKVSEEHLILNTRKCAGGMTIYKNELLYATAAKLLIKAVDIKNFNEDIFFKIKDDEFEVEELKVKASSIINQDKKALIKYLNNNSLLKGIYNFKNKILIITEIGKFSFDKNMHNSKRYYKFYIINKTGANDRIKTYKTKVTSQNNNCLFTIYDNHIYQIRNIKTVKKNKYEVSKIKLLLE